jgi:hypothetical protein
MDVALSCAPFVGVDNIVGKGVSVGVLIATDVVDGNELGSPAVTLTVGVVASPTVRVCIGPVAVSTGVADEVSLGIIVGASGVAVAILLTRGVGV